VFFPGGDREVRRDGSLRLSAEEIHRVFSDPKWAEAYPPILTVDQAASLLGVPKATIYDWSSRGRFSGCARRLGKHLRFFRDRLLLQVFNEGLSGQDT
jgi:excisionase family DNA binding protein